MNDFVKKFRKIIIPFIILFIICRISMAYGGIIGESDLNGFSITSLQTIDIALAIFFVYTLYIVMDISFKQKNNKTKKFKISAIIIIFIGLLFELIVSEFYYFQDPVGGCRYSELCEISSLLFYSKNGLTIFTDNKSIVYYQKYNKGWKVDNSYYYPINKFRNDDLEIQIYKIEDKYFIYVILQNNTSLKLLEDNTDYEFELMSVANSPNYFAYNRYGKIINSTDEYKIYYDSKQIKFN